MGAFIDLTGQKFGRLTIISRAENNKWNQICWNCLCDCENPNIIKVDGSSLKKGNTKSCGCLKEEYYKIEIGEKRRLQLVGQRFGKLVVTELDSIDKKQGTIWKCTCDCGNTDFIVSGTRLVCGIVKACGCQAGLHSGLRSGVGPKMEAGLASFNSLYLSYKMEAKRRDLSFSLPKDFFKEITKQDCAYCGVEPYKMIKRSSNGEYVYNGIDRVDNNIGYEINNIVPCCYLCNTFKVNLNIEDFMNWIHRIYNNNVFLVYYLFKEYEIRILKALYCVNKNRKRKRTDISFNLNIDDFYTIVRKNCYYCGSELSNIFTSKYKGYSLKIPYNGIDRVDNTKGYYLDNVVPCCYHCNRTKRDMTVEEFRAHIEKIYNHSIKDKNYLIYPLPNSIL